MHPYSGLFTTTATAPVRSCVIVAVGIVPDGAGGSRLDAAVRLSDGSHVSVPFDSLATDPVELELLLPVRPPAPCCITGCERLRVRGQYKCDFHK